MNTNKYGWSCSVRLPRSPFFFRHFLYIHLRLVFHVLCLFVLFSCLVSVVVVDVEASALTVPLALCCVCVCVCLWPFGHCVLYFNHVISHCATPSRTEHNTQRPKAFYLIIFHENEMLLLCISFGMCGWRIFLLCTRAREFMPLPVSKIVMFILCCRRNESTEWNPIMGAMSRGCTALHWDALRVYAHCTHNRQTGL